MRSQEQQPDLFAPIPLELPDIEGWKQLPIRECHEPLVPLGVFSAHDEIFTSSVYAGEHSNSPYWSDERHLQGSLMTQFVRADVAGRLRDAQAALPDNHYLIVLDSYRSLQVQGALYDHYLQSLAAQHPSWSPEALSQETQRYVSIPSRDQTRPSPHNTGGSVDLAIFSLPPEASARLNRLAARIAELRALAPVQFSDQDEARNPFLRELYLAEMAKQNIVRRHGTFLDFGTKFDHGGEAAGSNYIERQAEHRPLTQSEQGALYNRRLLYNVMLSAGMQAYSDEWWHFNSPKSQMGARAAGMDYAEYGAMELSSENATHETMRAMHHRGLVLLQEAKMRGERVIGQGVLQELLDLNGLALGQVGDPRIEHQLGEAEVIEPTSSVA